jgi:hypothetical protein
MKVRAVRVNGIVRVFFEDCNQIKLADLASLREQGRRLVFAGIEPAVMQGMRVIGLDRILELFPGTRVAEQVLCRRQTA